MVKMAQLNQRSTTDEPMAVSLKRKANAEVTVNEVTTGSRDRRRQVPPADKRPANSIISEKLLPCVTMRVVVVVDEAPS